MRSSADPLFVTIFGLLDDPGKSVPYRAQFNRYGLDFMGADSEINFLSRDLRQGRFSFDDRHGCLEIKHDSRSLLIYSSDPRFKEGLRLRVPMTPVNQSSSQGLCCVATMGFSFAQDRAF